MPESPLNPANSPKPTTPLHTVDEIATFSLAHVLSTLVAQLIMREDCSIDELAILVLLKTSNVTEEDLIHRTGNWSKQPYLSSIVKRLHGASMIALSSDGYIRVTKKGEGALGKIYTDLRAQFADDTMGLGEAGHHDLVRYHRQLRDLREQFTVEES